MHGGLAPSVTVAGVSNTGMARLWSSGSLHIQGLLLRAGTPSLYSACCHFNPLFFSSKISLSTYNKGHQNRLAAHAAADEPSATHKKHARLSKKERAALVESFVQKHFRSPSQQGCLNETLRSVKFLQEQGIPISRDLAYYIIHVCTSRQKDFTLGKCLYSLTVQSGLNCIAVLANHLIRVFTSSGHLVEANVAFANVVEPCHYTWNAIFEAHNKHANENLSLQLYDSMSQGDIMQNNFTLSVILKACGSKIGYGRYIHEQIIQSALQSEISVGTSLVKMYANCGSLDEACSVFDALPILDVVLFSVMIEGYAQHGEGVHALNCFGKMEEVGIKPNEVTFLSVLKACVTISALEQGRLIHDQILELGILTDDAVGNTLIDMYAKCGSMIESCKVFESLLKRTVVSWAVMISGFAEHGECLLALDYFEAMQRDGILPDRAAFLSILKACASLGTLEKGRDAYHLLSIHGIELDTVMGNALINMYAKCGSLEESCKVFHTLSKRDAISWATMVGGYAEHGKGALAINCFKEMQAEGVKPNNVTFLSVLLACKRVGLVDHGCWYFEQIKWHGFEPNMDQNNCMIDLLGHACYFKEAENILQATGESNLAGCISLMNSSRMYGNVELGRRCFDKLVCINPQHAAGHMASHDGAFPSLSTVVREIGGAKHIVKDILTELQSNWNIRQAESTEDEVDLNPELLNAAHDSEVEEDLITASECSKEESGEAKLISQMVSDDSNVAEFTVEDEEASSSSEAVADVNPSGDKIASDFEFEISKEQEKPGGISNFRKMTGETRGEIERHIDILNRIRSLGTESSQQKNRGQDASGSYAAEKFLQSSSIARSEDGSSPDQTVLSADKLSPKDGAGFSLRTSVQAPKHGMFVRFLHPSATEEDLRKAFEDCGEIARAQAVKPMKPTARFTYGFIDFKTAEGLSKALRKDVTIRDFKVETDSAPAQDSVGWLPDLNIFKNTKPTESPLRSGFLSKLVPSGSRKEETIERRDANSGRTAIRPTDPLSFDPAEGLTMNKNGSRLNGSRPFSAVGSSENGRFPKAINTTHVGVSNNSVKASGCGYAVYVETSATNVNLFQVKEALSVFGEITGSYVKHQSSNGISSYIEFMTEEAKENALAFRWIQLNGQRLRISRVDSFMTTVARVSNISTSISESDIMAACKSCGQVVRIQPRRDGVMDIFFHPHELKNMGRILDRLSDITIDHRRWYARPAPRCFPEEASQLFNSSDGREWISKQMKVLLKNHEALLQQMYVEHRDLEELTSVVLHALSTNTSSADFPQMPPTKP